MYHEFAQIAMEVAREAGQFLKHFSDSNPLNIEAKGSDFDFVTNADRESQALIARRIREKYPQHRFIGEEDGIPDAEIAQMLAQAGEDDYFWIADPLDGTLNYIHRLNGYSVSIGVVHRGKSIAGAIYVPANDEMFTASRGGGAFLNGTPIHASSCESLHLAVTATGVPVSDMELRRRFMAWMYNVGMKTTNTRMLGSAAMEMAYAASGRLDAFWEVGPHPWDVAAGLLIAEESGCVVSDIWGNPFSFDCVNGVMICAPAIHESLCHSIKEAE